MSEQENPGALVGRIVHAHRADIDQVHATGKAIGYQGNPTYTIELADGSLLAWPADLVTEVNEPSRDLPGTLRREDHEGGHSVFQAVEGPRGQRLWLCTYSTAAGNVTSTLLDQQVVDLPVIGTAPGTPAWEKEQVEIEHTDLFEPEQPRTFSPTGPEPPEDVRVLTDSGGYLPYLIRTSLQPSLWTWAAHPQEPQLPNRLGGPWDQVMKGRTRPMTEVV